MRRFLATACLAATPALAGAPKPAAVPHEKEKRAAVASIEKHATELVALSDAIWGYAETALQETRSSKALADYAASQGFRVERGVAGMPTAFVASFGQGKPVIGIMGEFDALAGLSQKAVDHREPLVADGAGHGCGHNLFGPGSLGAALAVKELIASGALSGTVRFYGTPAEEAVGGKIYMAREGLFKDCDAVFAWHPDYEVRANGRGSQAMVDLMISFHGTAAHAAYDPWNGRSALDGLELLTHGIDMMREHVKPTVRMHYVIVKGGDVPNVVPAEAKLWLWLRDSRREGVEELLARVRPMVEGAAMMAGVKADLAIQTGSADMRVSEAGNKLLSANLAWLPPITYTDAEVAFAKNLQKATGVAEAGLDGVAKPYAPQPPDPEGGSTDVADVSWNAPTVELVATTAPKDVPWHGWAVVASGGMSIGHKGMLYAARALSATMVDLFLDPAARAAMREEFSRKGEGKSWTPWIPAGPPPVPAAP